MLAFQPAEESDDTGPNLETLAALYVAGLDVNWEVFYEHAGRRRMVLPTYPFERKRFWIDRPRTRASAVSSKGTSRDVHERGRPTFSRPQLEDNSVLETDDREDDC